MWFLYYLAILPISLVPSWFLYKVSDVLYFIIYYVAGYRKKVVRINLKNSFPELTTSKLREIEQLFFVHFCDLIIESIKAFTISKHELDKRFTHRNPELFQPYFDKGQHVTLVGGHSGNWELYAVSLASHMSHQPVALFTPLTNKFLNEKITKSRSKYGLWMMRYSEVKERIKISHSKPFTVIFGADQCPNFAQQPYWTIFLNQETGVQFGTEKFARDNNTPVIYGFIHRLNRGHYEVEYKLITETPNQLQLGEITEMHTRLLEADIRNEPGFWLWTHKRWKRKKIDFQQFNERKNNV